MDTDSITINSTTTTASKRLEHEHDWAYHQPTRPGGQHVWTCRSGCGQGFASFLDSSETPFLLPYYAPDKDQCGYIYPPEAMRCENRSSRENGSCTDHEDQPLVYTNAEGLPLRSFDTHSSGHIVKEGEDAWVCVCGEVHPNGPAWVEHSRANSETAPVAFAPSLNTNPAPTTDGISPDTSIIHISAGPQWTDSKYVGWVKSLTIPYIVVLETDSGPARYESIEYSNAPRSWASIVVGIYRHPVTDARLAWAWKYYR